MLINMIDFKKILPICLLLAVIGASLYSAFNGSEPSGLPSYRLEIREAVDGDVKRLDYIDSDGNVTFAADKHYATIIKTYRDGHVVLEQYYDEKGDAAVQTAGHCALERHYNDAGLADVITYLDKDGEPEVTTSGYSSIHRSYNDLRLADTDTYYIGDERVKNANGFYAYKRGYNEEKRISEIEYLNEHGELALHKNGYARITRSYNDAGKVEYEFYFGTEREPVKNSSGCYGLYREYDEDGHAIVITFVDAEGRPMVGNKGYATVKRTYKENGSIESLRYFDAEGKPSTGLRSQYGIEYVDGQGVYLDEDGTQMFRLDNYLNNHLFVVVLFGIALTVMAVQLKGKWRVAFIIGYLLFICGMTLAYRESGVDQSASEFLWSYKEFVKSSSIRQTILNNIWLFVPLGAAVYSSEHPRRWIPVIGLSIVIELIQLALGIGLCEIDDVISNSIGTFIGYGIVRMWSLSRVSNKKSAD